MTHDDYLAGLCSGELDESAASKVSWQDSIEDYNSSEYDVIYPDTPDEPPQYVVDDGRVPPKGSFIEWAEKHLSEKFGEEVKF